MLNALQRRDASGLAHILRTHLRRKRDEVVQAGFAEPGVPDPEPDGSRAQVGEDTKIHLGA